MKPKRIELTHVTVSMETKQRLFELKPIVPKRWQRKSYHDVIVFLLNKFEEVKK